MQPLWLDVLLSYEQLNTIFEKHPDIKALYDEWHQLYFELIALKNQLVAAETKLRLLQSR